MLKLVKKTSKGKDVTIYIYNEVSNPKAVIQFVHGASEHLTRYEHLFEFLNQNGYICIGGDLLGHGESSHADGNYILFEEKECYESVTLVKDYILEEYNNLPLYLYGHSMGSFIARKLLIQYPNVYKKAIISGTTTMPGLLTTAAMTIAAITRVFRTKKGISPLLAELGLNGLPKKLIKSGLMTEGEMWITHNKEIADYYKNSPICGENFTVSSYQGMFSWVHFVSRKKNIRKGNLETPILFAAGCEDPLSNYGKDIDTTVNLYQSLGYTHVTRILYPKMRHEIHNEYGSQIVFSDYLNFLDN